MHATAIRTDHQMEDDAIRHDHLRFAVTAATGEVVEAMCSPDTISLSRKLRQWEQDHAAAPTSGPIPIVMSWVREVPRLFAFLNRFAAHFLMAPFELTAPLEASFADAVDEWYVQQLIDIDDRGELDVVMRTAHFLQLHVLTQLTCAYVASQLTTETPHAMERLFGLSPCFEADDVQRVATKQAPMARGRDGFDEEEGGRSVTSSSRDDPSVFLVFHRSRDDDGGGDCEYKRCHGRIMHPPNAHSIASHHIHIPSHGLSTTGGGDAA